MRGILLRGLAGLATCSVGLLGCAHKSGRVAELAQAKVPPKLDTSPSSYRHYLQAQIYSHEDQHAAAAVELREALNYDSSDLHLRTRYADELYLAGDINGSEKQIREVIRREPRSALAYLILSDVRRARGDLKGTHDALERALRIDPKNEDVYVELARTAEQIGDLPARKGVLRQWIKSVPKSAEAHYQMGVLQVDEGDTRGAVKTLRKSIALNAAHADARVELSDVLVSLGERKAAAALLSDGLESGADRLVVAEPLVELYLRQGRLDDARDVVRLLESEGTDAGRKVILANLHRLTRQPERAREIIDEAIGLEPGHERARLLSGNLYEDMGKPEQALGEYKRVPPRSPEFVTAIKETQAVLAGLGRDKEATDLIEHALSARPDSEELLALSAESMARQGRFPEAISRLEAALKRTGESHALLFSLATVNERAGNWQRSLDLMRRVLELDPRNPSALNFVGYLYADKGVELKAAESMLRQAMTLDPGNGFILDSLGWCLFKQGRLVEAQQVLEEADRLAPGDAEILRHLGEVYWSRKDRHRAVESYRRALKEGRPDDALRHRLEERLREIDGARSAKRP